MRARVALVVARVRVEDVRVVRAAVEVFARSLAVPVITRAKRQPAATPPVPVVRLGPAPVPLSAPVSAVAVPARRGVRDASLLASS